MFKLTDEQLERYSRHIILEQVGREGQQKIINAKVLIIGTGGLGSPAAMFAKTNNSSNKRPRQSKN